MIVHDSLRASTPHPAPNCQQLLSTIIRMAKRFAGVRDFMIVDDI